MRKNPAGAFAVAHACLDEVGRPRWRPSVLHTCACPHCLGGPATGISFGQTTDGGPPDREAGGSQRVEPFLLREACCNSGRLRCPRRHPACPQAACLGLGHAHRNDGGPQRAQQTDLHKRRIERRDCAGSGPSRYRLGTGRRDPKPSSNPHSDALLSQCEHTAWRFGFHTRLMATNLADSVQ